MSSKIKNMCFAALGAAVICVISPVSFPLGAVPITLSLFAVLVVAGIMPVRISLAAVLVYVALGAVGVPVFAGFNGGFQVLAGPTGGFIAAYIPAAVIVSFCRFSKVALGVSMALSTILCYILGSAWLSFTTETGFFAALWSTFLACIAADIAKIAMAFIISTAISASTQRYR